VGSYRREAYNITNLNAKWRRIGHGHIEKHALDWNLQRIIRRGRPKPTWDRNVLEKEGKYGKT
jgi:hypothetical protein